ncbi:MAG: PIN domain-containing protein [Candidatus Diapherotrites archaeon]|nr:PIN domain-containing protein [Candidatus Diapherotrites archaeon]
MNAEPKEFFVDSNILVYAFDESEPKKRLIAKKIVEDITKGEKKGIVSNQVLGELFFALTKKIEKPLKKETAQIIINGLIDSVHWKKVNYSVHTVSKAIEISIKENLPFWDSIILETMLENKVFAILTENTKDFASRQIKAKNPFK